MRPFTIGLARSSKNNNSSSSSSSPSSSSSSSPSPRNLENNQHDRDQEQYQHQHQHHYQFQPLHQSTPARSRLPLRPLQPRDHNVMMRQNRPLTAKSGNANMPPYDKQNATRPLMPSLSATAKTSNKAPLTPRVAGSIPPSAATPLSRRGARPEINTTPVGSSREDLSTPVSTFLNNNITPRSGSRKSRVDSTNTTPTGTPTEAPANESFRISQDVSSHGSGLGLSGMDKDLLTRPVVSFSPSVSEVGFSKSHAPSVSGDSKFFFASDAKSVQAPRPQLQAKAPSSFFYANGDSIPQPPPQSPSASAVGSTFGEERGQSKFFHANGTPDLQSSPNPHFPPPRTNSTVSTSSRINSPRLASPGTLSPPQRPTSPSKVNQSASMASLRAAPNLPSPLLSRPQQGGRGQSSNNVVASRRASIEVSPRVTNHSPSTSAGSPDLKLPSRKISSGSSLDTIASATPLNIITNSVPVSTPEEISEEVETSTDTDAISGLQSPTNAGHSIEHMNELAANARRERKVLDLEITNSSLAAINRTLEREMRKQTAELRRFRRLSRSGRLSIATSASLRTSSCSLSVNEGIEGRGLSDMSEEESEEETDYDSSEESVDDGSMSPHAMAESDLRHRKRDEKRLQLDLSKHQQLLIDSQKMNQSLKRCLGWTEELINEGKKALAYSVRVSDIELGGRVLAPDEVEDGENEGMSNVGAELLKQARIAAANGSAAWGREGRDERDSGIELQGPIPEPRIYSQLP